MTFYPDALVPIDAATDGLHREELAHFAAPGTWLSAEERLATLQAARSANSRGGDGRRAEASILPDDSLRLIEKVAATPRPLSRDDFARALDAGMTAGEYVETISLVSRVVNLDVFARELAPARWSSWRSVEGDPSCESPPAVAEGAWLPSVPAGPQARQVYGSAGPQPFIYRALSLVPEETRRCIAGGNVQYLPLDKFMDFSYSHQPGLSRVQVEIVAARISALNDCFY